MNKTEFRKILIEERIEVVFTEELTFEHLFYLKEDLKTKGITINYRSLAFDKNNQLQSIDCEINCNDGFSGSFTTNYLHPDDKGKRHGFYRDYSDESTSPFGISYLGEL